MTEPYSTKTSALLLQAKMDADRHEGYREYAYPDPLSKLGRKYKKYNWGFEPAAGLMAQIPGVKEEDGAPWTVGYGDTHGVTSQSRMPKIRAERRLEEHILAVHQALSSTLAWYDEASFVTKTVLINMAYNMGLKGLLGFKNTLAYMKAGQWNQAARNMEKSLWYKQVGSRAAELTKRISSQTIEPQHRAPETLK